MSQYFNRINKSFHFEAGKRMFLLICFLVIMTLTTAPVPTARAAALMVNTTNDVDDGMCDSNHCSLREALVAANQSAGSDVISFDFSNPQTIAISSPLPALTSNGTTIQGMGMVTLNGNNSPGSTSGIVIHSSNNRIQGLRIRSFPRYGVLISTPDTYTAISGNVIGTDGDGINDDLEGNVIDLNAWSAVMIEDNWPSYNDENTNNIVAGNYLGIGPNGSQANGNGGTGVGIYNADNNRIGTNIDDISDDLERNVIGSNEAHGVYIGGGSTGNHVSGNYIGLNASGTTARPNKGDGVAVYHSESNIIEGNVISNNDNNGVALAASSHNIVIDNYIGTGPSGSVPMGNEANGIRIFGLQSMGALHNQIGYIIGPYQILLPVARPNVIAYNAWNGIYIDSHTEGFVADMNAILYNSIFDNDMLGIDLVSSACPEGLCTDGVTINDPNDTDSGGNSALNYPTITSAGNNGVNTLIQADIVSGLPNTTFIVQFFSSPTCDPSGNGEGQIYLGDEHVTTDNSGFAFVNISSLPTTPVGEFVTATATTYGTGTGPVTTSEFSACYEVTSMSTFTLSSLKNLKNILSILFENGMMDEDQAVQLGELVDRATQEYERGNNEGVINYLERFNKTVKSLIEERQVPEVQGSYLLDSAQTIIDLLSNDRSRCKPSC